MHKANPISLLAVNEYLLKHDVRPANYVRDLGLDPTVLLGGALWIDRNAGLRIAGRLSRATGDATPGLHIGGLMQLRSFGLWSESILASATLNEALVRATRQIGLLESGRALHLIIEGDRVRLRSEFLGRMQANPQVHQVASLVLLSRYIDLASEHIPLTVRMARHRPGDTSEFERSLGPELCFGADVYELEFSREALFVPMDRQRIDSIPSVQRATLQMHSYTAAAVAQAIERRITSHRPGVEEVARDLSMNVRSMQRYLALWGVTYAELLDHVLYQHAVTAMLDQDRSITEIALGLGYSDPAHFSRAFKRWTGFTPRYYRSRELRSPPALLTSLLKPGTPTRT